MINIIFVKELVHLYYSSISSKVHAKQLLQVNKAY